MHAIGGTTGALLAITVSAGGALVLGAWGIVGRLAGGPSAAVLSSATRFALLQALSGLLVQVLHRGGVVAVALLAGSRVETGYAALAAASPSR